MDIFKKSGFKNRDEYELYQDVCCEFMLLAFRCNIIDDHTFDLVNIENNGGLPSKETFEKVIEEYELSNLFKKVESMSLLDRYIELFIYHANSFSLYNNMVKLKEENVNNAIIKGDEKEAINNITECEKYRIKSIINLDCEKYILRAVHDKTPFEEKKFFESINDICYDIFHYDVDNNQPPIL